MRLSEQREALINSSAAPSPPANNDDAAEPQFLIDEETPNQNTEEKANVLEPGRFVRVARRQPLLHRRPLFSYMGQRRGPYRH